MTDVECHTSTDYGTILKWHFLTLGDLLTTAGNYPHGLSRTLCTQSQNAEGHQLASAWSGGAKRATRPQYVLELVHDKRERRPLNRIGLKATGGKREDDRWAAGHFAPLVERGRLTIDNNRHECAQVSGGVPAPPLSI